MIINRINFTVRDKIRALLVPEMVKNLPATWETCVESPGREEFLEKSMDRRTWWATVYGVTKSRTSLSN